MLIRSGLGVVVILGVAWFFYSTAGDRGHRQAALTRHSAVPILRPGTYAAIVRAMAVGIAVVAVVAFVLIAIRV